MNNSKDKKPRSSDKTDEVQMLIDETNGLIARLDENNRAIKELEAEINALLLGKTITEDDNADQS